MSDYGWNQPKAVPQGLASLNKYSGTRHPYVTPQSFLKLRLIG